MCELFAYSSRIPARMRFAFREFARHGGPHAANPDGWGAAYFDGVDAHVLREAQPALTSASFIPVLEKHDFHSPLVIAHIRRASRGPANFLFSDGDLLFAHAHHRLSHPGNTWVPGLHLLLREAANEHRVHASGLHIQGRDDKPAPAVLLASVPLTPEAWEPQPENTLLVLQQGRLIARINP